MSVLRCRVLIAAVAVALICGSSHAGDQIPLEHRLPEAVIAFVQVPDVSAVRSDAAASTLGRLFADPSMREFQDELAAKWNAGLRQTGVLSADTSLNQLLDAATGEFAMAMVQVVDGSPAIVITLEVKSAAAFHQHVVSRFIQAGAASADVDHGGVRIAELTSGQTSQVRRTLAAFHRGDRFVLTNSTSLAKQLIDNWDGTAEKSFGKSLLLERVRKTFDRDGLERKPAAFIFLDPARLLTAFSASRNPSTSSAVRTAAAMLTGVDGVGVTLDLNQRGTDTLLQIAGVVRDGNALSQVLQLPSTSLSLPEWVPDSVSSCVAFNWDAERSWQSLEQLSDQIIGPGRLSESVEAFATNPSGPMIHLRKDIVEQLTGRGVLIEGTAASTDGQSAKSSESASSTLAGLELKDSVAMRGVLDRLTRQPNVETRRVRETQVLAIKGRSGSMLHLAVAHQSLLLANDIRLLEQTLAPRDAASASLTDSEDWKRVRKLLPAQASLIGVQRRTGSLQTAFEALRHVPASASGVDFGKLPPFEKVQPFLPLSGSWATPAGEGFRYVSFTLKPDAVRP